MISQRDGVTTTEQLRILITKLLQITFGPCLPADSCHPRMLEMIKHIERSSECQADALLAGSDYIIMHGQGLFQLLQRIIMQSASCDGGYLFQVLFAERAEREISVAGQQGIATLEKQFGRDEPLKGGTGNYQVLPRRKRQLLRISGDKSHLPVRQQVGKASAHLVAYIIQYQLFRMKGAEQRTGQEPGSAAYLKHMPRTCRQVMCQHIVQATGYLFLRRGLTVITF